MAQDSTENKTKKNSYKSFRNEPGQFMEQALGGLVAAHPNAQWHEEGFISLNETGADGNGDRVAVISGGGSGHEPMHAGFIGSGMLDAACPGLLLSLIHISEPTRRS